MAIRFVPSGYARNSVVVNTGVVTQMCRLRVDEVPSGFGGVIGFMDGLGSPVLDKDLVVTASMALDYQIYDGGTQQANSGSDTLTLGKWAHVAATADGSNITIYKDGISVASAGGGSTYQGYTVPNIFIAGHGTRSDTTTRYIGGTFSDITVWRTALTAAQIRAIALGLIEPWKVSPGSIQFYWPFYESGIQRSLVPSAVGGQDDGTLTATPYYVETPGRVDLFAFRRQQNELFFDSSVSKTGSGVSARVASGDGVLTEAAAGSGISPRTGSGADVTTYAETGAGVAAWVASGPSRLGADYFKSGLSESPRTASGTSVYVQAEVPPGAHIAFNVARGRIPALVDRVNTNDPANCALIVVVVKKAGLEDDDGLKSYDTLSALLAGSTNEVTNSGYARITLDQSSSVTAVVNDTGNFVMCDFPDQSWSSVGASGGAWGALLVCYDADTTSGTDSTVIPLTKHDFYIVPDGRNIYATVSSEGFARA